jgi:hypothetical protein
MPDAREFRIITRLLVPIFHQCPILGRDSLFESNGQA